MFWFNKFSLNLAYRIHIRLFEFFFISFNITTFVVCLSLFRIQFFFFCVCFCIDSSLCVYRTRDKKALTPLDRIIFIAVAVLLRLYIYWNIIMAWSSANSVHDIIYRFSCGNFNMIWKRFTENTVTDKYTYIQNTHRHIYTSNNRTSFTCSNLTISLVRLIFSPHNSLIHNNNDNNNNGINSNENGGDNIFLTTSDKIDCKNYNNTN